MKTSLSALLLLILFAKGIPTAHALPITDTVIVNGIEWAQPDLFTGLSPGIINAECRSDEGGACKKTIYNNGTINGFDVAGWTWASMNDVNALFNFFLAAEGVSGDDLLSGRDYFYGYDYTNWGPNFFAAGFRGTNGTNFLDGLVSTKHTNGNYLIGRFVDYEDPEPDIAQVFFTFRGWAPPNPRPGAFLYRQAAPETVSAPPTWLLLTASFGLMFARVKRRALSMGIE